MRVALFAVFSMAFSFGAMAADTADHQMETMLNTNSAEIQVLGILRYCDKLGLRGPLYEKIADSIVQSSEADANDMLRIADVQSVGVMMGLDLAKLSPASKARICEKATTYVDKILRSKMEK